MERLDLGAITVTVVGGDAREVELIRGLVQSGARVQAVGFPPGLVSDSVIVYTDLYQALATADVVVAPMSNTDVHGKVEAVMDPSVSIQLDERAFARLRPGTPLFIGKAKPVIRDLADKYRIPVIETGEIDEIAIPNSIPTAEGVLMLAMERMPITLHGSRVVVVGFGRCGLTLGRMLQGIGAKTTVVARSLAQLARAAEMGLNILEIARLPEAVSVADLVVNTVPAPVLTGTVLAVMPKEALVIDIASAPGGTDFAAAKELGIEAIHALGLPGKVAPKTAGLILADTIPKLISQLMSQPKQPTSES
ncbi:MAG: dipicolinate synthase subunit DpsA [Firmicutes bacterium]|nr:dipicolinate synthase subunit DpsA [Bacillota bacterium]